ncbi:MAG: hypothetical protein ABI569_09970 [Casimicrobiaceae bacterium]
MAAPPKSRSPAPAAPPRKPAHRRFEIDRIILLRAAFAVVVVLFLYMILRVSMIAYGGSAKREAKHIEREIEGPHVQAPAAAAGTPAKAPAPPSP